MVFKCYYFQFRDLPNLELDILCVTIFNDTFGKFSGFLMYFFFILEEESFFEINKIMKCRILKFFVKPI